MENFRVFVEDPKFQRQGPLKVSIMLNAESGKDMFVRLDDGREIVARVTWTENFEETHLIKVHAERPNPDNETMIDLIEVYHYTDVGTPDVVYIRPAPKP